MPDSDFRTSLTETSLYSIGAYFTDAHPELVDDVVAEAESIEKRGLAAYAKKEGIDEEAAFKTLVTGLAIRFHRALGS